VSPPVNYLAVFRILKNSKQKDTHTMKKDHLIEIQKASKFIDDPITQILRNGARKLLAKAFEAEINCFIEQYDILTDDEGCKRITCNDYLSEREIQIGICPIRVKAPMACDRKGNNG